MSEVCGCLRAILAASSMRASAAASAKVLIAPPPSEQPIKVRILEFALVDGAASVTRSFAVIGLEVGIDFPIRERRIHRVEKELLTPGRCA